MCSIECPLLVPYSVDVFSTHRYCHSPFCLSFVKKYSPRVILPLNCCIGICWLPGFFHSFLFSILWNSIYFYCVVWFCILDIYFGTNLPLKSIFTDTVLCSRVLVIGLKGGILWSFFLVWFETSGLLYSFVVTFPQGPPPLVNKVLCRLVSVEISVCWTTVL